MLLSSYDSDGDGAGDAKRGTAPPRAAGEDEAESPGAVVKQRSATSVNDGNHEDGSQSSSDAAPVARARSLSADSGKTQRTDSTDRGSRQHDLTLALLPSAHTCTLCADALLPSRNAESATHLSRKPAGSDHPLHADIRLVGPMAQLGAVEQRVSEILQSLVCVRGCSLCVAPSAHSAACGVD